MIINHGQITAGIHILKYSGISLSAVPTLAKTKAFLKDKWGMAELKDPPFVRYMT